MGVVDTSSKFSTGIIDTGGKFATGVNNTSKTGGKICRWCCWYQLQICRWCRWDRRQFCHWCHWHRWCTLFSGAWGKVRWFMKKPEAKILWHCPFKPDKERCKTWIITQILLLNDTFEPYIWNQHIWLRKYKKSGKIEKNKSKLFEMYAAQFRAHTGPLFKEQNILLIDKIIEHPGLNSCTGFSSNNFLYHLLKLGYQREWEVSIVHS